MYDKSIVRLCAFAVCAGTWVATAACGHTAATQQPSASAATTTATTPESEPPKRALVEARQAPASARIGEVMSDHFMITSWSRDAVIAGDVELLRRPLTLLADYKYAELPAGGWVPWLAQLQSAARLTANAATIEAAAMGVATMARVCGECHTAMNGGPMFAAPPNPVERVAADTMPERMGRHMLASSLLWEGLTGPSDDIWNAGAAALIAAPEQLDADLPASFDQQLRDVKALGQEAREASTLAERADVYGLLIATCADCHTRFTEHAW